MKWTLNISLKFKKQTEIYEKWTLDQNFLENPKLPRTKIKISPEITEIPKIDANFHGTQKRREKKIGNSVTILRQHFADRWSRKWKFHIGSVFCHVMWQFLGSFSFNFQHFPMHFWNSCYFYTRNTHINVSFTNVKLFVLSVIGLGQKLEASRSLFALKLDAFHFHIFTEAREVTQLVEISVNLLNFPN